MVVAGCRRGAVFPRTVTDADGDGDETWSTTSSCTSCGTPRRPWPSRPAPTSRRCRNVLGHESAGLTLDRYGHLYGSDVEAVGVAINDLLTRNCGQNVGTDSNLGPRLQP